MRSILLVLCMCAAVGGPSFAELNGIDYMILGKQVYEVADTWQLTHAADGKVTETAISPNGKQVAFLAIVKERYNLCLVSATGGQVTTVLATASDEDIVSGKLETAWGVKPPIVWSPDGRQLALIADRYTQNEKGQMSEPFLVLLSSNGKFIASIQLSEVESLADLRFSPDGQQIACTATRVREPESEGQAPSTDLGLGIVDIAQNSFRFIPTPDLRAFTHWSANGRGLCYVSLDHKRLDNRQVDIYLREVDIVSGNNRPVWGPLTRFFFPSPNGLLRAEQRGREIWVTNCGTSATLQLIKSKMSGFGVWAPNNNMFSYNQDESINDHTGTRQTTVKTLWIAGLESHKLNSMCMAIDVDDTEPSWTADSLKIAYTSKGRLHVTELKKRQPTPREKADAGLPLTEKEEQTLLLENAKEIGMALQMYRADWEDKLPATETIEKDVVQYMRWNDTFLRPGTDENIFSYFPSNLTSMQPGNECNTIMGELDAGYNWKVILYADGHSKVVPKE